MISNFTIGDLMMDCADAKRACDFYANLTGARKTVEFGCLALKTDNGLTILFEETDFAYMPPVWPEQQDKQQKQMHLDFTVDDLPSAVEKAIRLANGHKNHPNLICILKKWAMVRFRIFP